MNITDIKQLTIKELEQNFTKMTNDEWQQQFALLRSQIKPIKDTKLTNHTRNAYIVGRRWYLTDNTHRESQFIKYCNYINDVLKVIKRKRDNEDYVYHVYQICDLLKFEPNLQAELIHMDTMSYFKVWLDNSNNI